MMDVESNQSHKAFLQRLLVYLDGRARDQERDSLQAELKADADKRQLLYQTCIRIQQVRQVLQRTHADPGSLVGGSLTSLTKPHSFLRLRSVLCVAAALLLVLALLLLWRHTMGRPTMFATLTFSSRAVWAPDSDQPLMNDPITDVPYQLDSGTVRLDLPDHTMVSISGPALFHFAEPHVLVLEQGILTAQVFDPTSQFTVRTTHVDIVDRGTAFGVHVLSNQQVTVSVFSGAVDVFDRDEDPRGITLEAGTSLAADAQGQFIDVDYTTTVFRQLWPLATGIDEVSPLVHLLGPGPIDRLKKYASNEQLFMIPERQNVLLRRTIPVDFSQPGEYLSFKTETQAPIKAGTRVNSYLLFFNPDEAKSWTHYHQLSGTIVFAKPIVGIIGNHQRLAASDQLFGRPDTQYGRTGGRGLDTINQGAQSEQAHDVLRISADRRSLYFELNVGPLIDQFRVLVEAD